MPEALARLERLDDLVAVDELDGAGVDDEEVPRGLAVLDERVLARPVGALGGRAHQPLELVGRHAVERGVPGEEGGELGRRAQAADSLRAGSTTRKTGTSPARRWTR